MCVLDHLRFSKPPPSTTRPRLRGRNPYGIQGMRSTGGRRSKRTKRELARFASARNPAQWIGQGRTLFSWRSVVRLVGGIYTLGALSVMIHDRGILVAWRQVIKWERRLPRQSGRSV